MKKRVVYIISYIDKALGFEWVAERLNKEKFDLSFVLLNDSPSFLKKFLESNNIPVVEYRYKGKKDIPRVALRLFFHLFYLKPDVVHTHLVDADFIGLLIARLIGIKKRIYTRHNSTYHKSYHSKAQRLDRINNANSTMIASISQNTTDVMVNYEHVPKEKIRLVYHGFDLAKFENVPEKEIEELSKKYNRSDRQPVIGVISRYMHWKGIQYIIPAFKKLLKTYPNALIILANAKQNAPYQATIEKMLEDLPADSFTEIIFENNLFALYPLFDIFVHVPIDHEIEAFGQIYVESLAAGIPSIFTLSGIAKEYIVHGHNALVVPFRNSEKIHDSIIELLSDPKLCLKLIENGKKSVKEKFSVETMINNLESMYLE